MTAQEVAQHLHAKKSGSRWWALCPAHPDRKPSLTIQAGRKAVLLTCQSRHCPFRSILESSGLKIEDLLYTSEPRKLTPLPVRDFDLPGKRGKTQHGPLEATYHYTDAQGKLLAEKLRYGGKVFLWRRPEGGDWVWKVPKAMRPLYRLHEVVKAHSVFLVEGEKDADRIAGICRAGWSATTAPDGAASWKREFAGWLRGKRVFIIPDSDEPGRAYAEAARRSLLGVATGIKIVTLPAKDVSAFLDSHTVDELRSLIRR